MFNSRKQKSVVGLEIEAGSVAAVEVAVNGYARVKGQGAVVLGPGIFREGEVSDADGLTEALKELFGTYSLSKHVRLGVSNQRVVVRRMRVPAIDDSKDLESAIRFQAQEEIPMPIDTAVLDWVVEGERRGENGERQLDVVVVAARRDMVTVMLGALRQAGLSPVGIDLSAFGMIRALAEDGAVASPQNGGPGTGVIAGDTGPPEIAHPAGVGQGPMAPVAGDDARELAAVADVPVEQDLEVAGPKLFCNLGDVLTLAVADGRSCLFARVSPFGIEGIAQRLAEHRRLALAHARQWLVHVGLDRPLESIEGDPEIVAATSTTLVDGVAKLAGELRLSIQAYSAQVDAQPIESVVVCGSGSAIPGLVARVERELGLPVAVGRPAALAGLDAPAAARLTLPYGLALEK